MAFNDEVDQMYLQQERVVRRAGVAAADLPLGVNFNIFTVPGPILVKHIWGEITVVIAGAAVPQIQHTPTVGAGAVPLCAAALTLNGQVAGTILTYPLGIILAVLAPSPAIGMADTAATGWGGDYTILVAGVISIINGVAATGVIDWYIDYIPCRAVSVVTPL